MEYRKNAFSEPRPTLGYVWILLTFQIINQTLHRKQALMSDDQS